MIVLLAADVELSNIVLLTTAGCLVAVMVIPGVWSARGLWRQLGARVIVFPDRLVHERKQGSIDYRWDDLREFYYSGVDRYVVQEAELFPGEKKQHLETEYSYRFCHANGRSFEFGELFDDEDTTPLARAVEERLLECKLPALRKRFLQEHESIAFGPIMLESEGIRQGRSLLPWSEVDDVCAEGGYVQVRRRGKKTSWCLVKLARVPNCCLLLALAKERLVRQEAPLK